MTSDNFNNTFTQSQKPKYSSVRSRTRAMSQSHSPSHACSSSSFNSRAVGNQPKIIQSWEKDYDSNKIWGDRFIPSRSNTNYNTHKFYQNPQKPQNQYQQLLAKVFLDESQDEGQRILSFKEKPKSSTISIHDLLNDLYVPHNSHKIDCDEFSSRYIPSTPLRVLDAPDIIDDYYLNLISWGENDVLAVALGPTVYLWNAVTGKIEELMTLKEEDEYVSSVSWVQRGGYSLAVGTSNSVVQLWDASKQKQLRAMKGHKDRVGALAWNDSILTSGSKDTRIIHHDVRVKGHRVAKLYGHTQEICGLAWSPDGTMLASGANDNKVNIYKGPAATQKYPTRELKQHTAAVKALAWCPWDRNLLASGGGTADRKINFWNVSNGCLLNSIDTRSQVSSLVWSKTRKEILSSHGFSQNQLCLWSYPKMTKIKELRGHTSRILNMVASPDGTQVLSSSADETLRIWNVFDVPPEKKFKQTKKRVPNKIKMDLFPGAFEIR